MEKEALTIQEKEEIGKLKNTAFWWISAVFLFSCFTASLFASFFLNRQGENNFLPDLFLSILFFLPVIFAILYFRIYIVRKKFASHLGRDFFPFFPPQELSNKKIFYLLSGAFSAGFFLQVPILVICRIQKILLQYLSIDLPPQERVRQIVQLFENGENIFAFLPLLISVLFLAPLAEELFFRMILFEKLRQYIFSETAAMISASFIFALFHGNAAAFVPLFFVGMCCQKIYLKSSSLLAAFLLHFAFNLSTFILLFFQKG